MQNIGHQGICAAAIISLLSGTALAGPSAAEKCESAKNKTAGKYALCRAKAEAKAIKKSLPPDYSKCDAKLDKRWSKAELPAACLDTVTRTAIQDFVTANTDTIASALASGSLPQCGDGTINVTGEHCDGADLDGYSCASLGHFGGTLACDPSCEFDVSGCSCASYGGIEEAGFCWFLAIETDCDTVCTGAGLTYSTATATYAGDSGTLAQCYDVMDALGQISPPYNDIGDFDCLGDVNIGVGGLGCIVTAPSFPLRLRCNATATNSSASSIDIYRACACE